MILHRSRYRCVPPARPLVAVVCGAVMSLGSVTATELEPEPDSDPIVWRDDYGQALAEAQAAHRLLWIQFTGPWCPNCARMEHDSFPDPAIIRQARQSFVPLKLRSDVHEQLALAFNLSGLPATVIVAPTREIVAVRQGYLGPDELDALLGAAAAARRGREGSAAATGSSAEGSARARSPSTRPRSEPQLALSGYCPVSLISARRLVRGQAEYTVEHEGRTYRFASSVIRNQFRTDPERYVPVNRGDCPVSQVERGAVEPGDPRWGVLYQGRLFLCATEAARRRFLKDPEHYALVDVAEQGFCPHCLGAADLLVPGDPKYSLTRDGRRYWFPDPSHRAAFLAATGTTATRP